MNMESKVVDEKIRKTTVLKYCPETLLAKHIQKIEHHWTKLAEFFDQENQWDFVKLLFEININSFDQLFKTDSFSLLIKAH